MKTLIFSVEKKYRGIAWEVAYEVASQKFKLKVDGREAPRAYPSRDAAEEEARAWIDSKLAN